MAWFSSGPERAPRGRVAPVSGPGPFPRPIVWAVFGRRPLSEGGNPQVSSTVSGGWVSRTLSNPERFGKAILRRPSVPRELLASRPRYIIFCPQKRGWLKVHIMMSFASWQSQYSALLRPLFYCFSMLPTSWRSVRHADRNRRTSFGGKGKSGFVTLPGKGLGQHGRLARQELCPSPW